MLKDVRDLINALRTFDFSDTFISSVMSKEEIPLKTWFGCVVLMHQYLHMDMNIMAVIRGIMRRYPSVVNVKLLNVGNETNALYYDLLVATELSKRIGRFVSATEVNAGNLEDIVDLLMSTYLVS